MLPDNQPRTIIGLVLILYRKIYIIYIIYRNIYNQRLTSTQTQIAVMFKSSY